MKTSLHCNTCGKDVHKDKQYVIIRDDLWKQVYEYYELSSTIICCKDCIERALGRKLEKEDYYNREEPIYVED